MDRVVKNSDGTYTINRIWLGKRYSLQVSKQEAERLKLLAQKPRFIRAQNNDNRI